MSPKITAPRGTRDLLPEEAATWTAVEQAARELSRLYAFDRIEVPLFERVELWARGAGETSDVVEKEMFRVGGARGSEEEGAAWALRPEPTASIVRAYVEHGMHVRPGPLRLTMIGPMFRYDRPQAGRYRQFTQWDVEVIGDPGPLVDAELVELAQRFYRHVGLQGVVAHVNSIGDDACRPGYRAALLAYFGQVEDRLSDESRRRLTVNPLRVLDDKDLAPDIVAAAPRSVDHLCEPCRTHFEGFLAALDELGCRYQLDHGLVRGLDYYTRTTFELFVAGSEGQQQALGGGGRYDGLVELLGGRPTPGIGFGVGIDRTVLALGAGDARRADRPLVAVVGEVPGAARLRVASVLRDAGIPVRPDGSDRRLAKQLESAVKHGATHAVLVGQSAAADTAILRDLAAGEQREVAVADLPRTLAATMPLP